MCMFVFVLLKVTTCSRLETLFFSSTFSHFKSNQCPWLLGLWAGLALGISVDALLLAAYLWRVDWDAAMKAAQEQARSNCTDGPFEKYSRVSSNDGDEMESVQDQEQLKSYFTGGVDVEIEMKSFMGSPLATERDINEVAC